MQAYRLFDWKTPVRLPMTVGHEIGGWIESLGLGVSGFERGQPCLVTITGCTRAP